MFSKATIFFVFGCGQMMALALALDLTELQQIVLSTICFLQLLCFLQLQEASGEIIYLEQNNPHPIHPQDVNRHGDCGDFWNPDDEDI